LAVSEIPANILDGGDGLTGRGDVFQQVPETLATVYVVGIGDGEQGANQIKVTLRLGGQRVAGAAEGAPPVRAGRKFLAHTPGAVTTLVELLYKTGRTRPTCSPTRLERRGPWAP
jgi:hypothetical protein